MFNKRGQFFLVAALVISGILIGLAGIYTEVNAPQEDLSVYDLSSELNYESLQVIDQGVYTGLSQQQINNNILNLTEYYVEKDPKKDFTIVYGDEESVTVRQYVATDTGSVGVSTGGSRVTENVVQRKITETNAQPSGENIVINIGNSKLSFKITLGQQFYVVVSSSAYNQTYVAGGSSSHTGTRCGGTEPSGDGVKKGNERYDSTFTGTKTWNYKQTSSTLSPCQWTCKSGFERDGNSAKCKRS